MIYRGNDRRMFLCPDGFPTARGGAGDSNESMRQNLRIPLCRDIYLYPLDNSWVGRRKVVSYDLSSGGIAFFSDTPFQMGETLEILIPITSKPLLIQGKILRQERFEDGRTLYAAEFINLCEGEDAMIREAVFSTQVKQHKRR